jgi:hypothetical protein
MSAPAAPLLHRALLQKERTACSLLAAAPAVLLRLEYGLSREGQLR